MLYSLKKVTGNERPKDKSTRRKNDKKAMRKYHPLSPYPHPDMNQTPTTFNISPSFIIAVQWYCYCHFSDRFATTIKVNIKEIFMGNDVFLKIFTC